jgi:hypothetical protein
MKFRLFSDLHLEFGGFTIPSLEDDKDTTLLLAGDIAVGKRKPTYLDFLANAVDQFRKVVYIPGNHEYYAGSFKVTWQKMQYNMVERLRDQGMDAYLHMINNRTVVDGDVAIIGSTMWADFQNQNPMTMETARTYMNDYHHIRRGTDKDPWSGKLTPMDTLKAHIESRVFIFEEIRKHKEAGRKVVVMTHHAPSFQSTGEGFERDPLNGAYMTELAYQILELDDEGLAPDIWVHGHVHNSFDYQIGSTRVLTNPRGYVKYTDGFPENRAFDPEFSFEL